MVSASLGKEVKESQLGFWQPLGKGNTKTAHKNTVESILDQPIRQNWERDPQGPIHKWEQENHDASLTL